MPHPASADAMALLRCDNLLNRIPNRNGCQQTYILYKTGDFCEGRDNIGPGGSMPSNPNPRPNPPAEKQPAPSFRPLYEQIKVLLTQSLIAGEWKPGDAIPSEMDLAVRYQVSQGTVRKAIDALAAENIVIRRQGKGTYVATHTEPKHQYRFLRVFPDDGERYHPKTTFIDIKRLRAGAEVARALDLRSGTMVTAIRRVLVFNGKPVILDEVVLPAALIPNLTMEKIQESKGSIYSFFETNYGLRMIRAEERLRAMAADGFAAEHLEVAVGTPLLCVDRVAYTYGDKPVEYRRGLCRTDGHSYFTELA
jgi:GntR family transcriptional regulator